MGQLFKTAACFTDIHYGLKQNSRLHIQDCSRYIDWFIAEAKAKKKPRNLQVPSGIQKIRGEFVFLNPYQNKY